MSIKSEIGVAVREGMNSAFQGKVIFDEGVFLEIVAQAFMKGWSMSEYCKGPDRIECLIEERNAFVKRIKIHIEGCRITHD